MSKTTRSTPPHLPPGGRTTGSMADPTIATVPGPADTHRLAAAVVLNDFLVAYLSRLYKEFDGDLLLALVLGEIAHHNISALRTAARSPLEFSASLRRALQAGPVPRLPTNAYSIAQATGIPRQTVRRKLAVLEAKGWIARDAKGNLTVTPEPRVRFAAWNEELRREFLAAAGAVQDLDRAAREATGTGRGRAPARRG